MPSFLLSRNDEIRTLETIKRVRRDRVAFAKAFFGMEVLGRQEELLNLTGKVQTAVAGRRFGKSTLTLVKAVHACVTRPKQKWFVAGPSIDQAKLYFSELERFMVENPLLERVIVPKSLKYNPYPIVEFRSGSVMEARSTTLDGRYLRGKGADGVVVTEAAFVRDVVWNEVIRALLLDRKGTALVESTPNGGGNWTYNLFNIGKSDPDGYYTSFHATCYENQRLDEIEIERIRREIPDIAFRQEYLAEFVDDDSSVFPWRVLVDIFEDYQPLGRPVPEHRYVIGVDLAKTRDFTVIAVLDTTKEPLQVAEWHRMQGVPYTDVAALVNDACERYQCKAWIDATGVGEAVAEQVRNRERIVFTPKVREDLIARLQVTCEQKRVLLPQSLSDLRDEMRYFRRVEHGARVKAEAPQGQHDDTVMALALAVWGATESPYAGLMEYYRRIREGIAVVRGGTH